MFQSLRTLARTACISALPPVSAQRLQFLLKEVTRRQPIKPTGDPANDRILSAIDHDGFAVLPGYLSHDACRDARSDIDTAIREFPESVHRHADDRLFGVERVSPTAHRALVDEQWLTLANAYTGEPTVPMFTMANRIEPGATEGSGGGWHRDGFARELKVIVYLTDVGDQNGPFQIVRASHTADAICADMRTAGLRAVQNRLSQTEVSRIIAADPDRRVTVTGECGTAIVFDTSAVHRGVPSAKGSRYALTVDFC